MKQVLPYFAEMSGGYLKDLNQYYHWVEKLRKVEFADELVVAVTAQKLNVPIVVVPENPDWVIQTHPDPSTGAHPEVDFSNSVYLGNSNGVGCVFALLII